MSGESALVAAVRSAGHAAAAAKLAKQEELARRVEEQDEHSLTEQEAADQIAHAFTVEERQAVQQIEYGTWVAACPISVDGVLAFRAGDPVPVSHVERFGWDQTDPPQVVPAGRRRAPAKATAETKGGKQR